MDRKWLEERGKAKVKVKGERTVPQPSAFSLKVWPESLTPPAFTQPMTLTTQPTVAP